MYSEMAYKCDGRDYNETLYLSIFDSRLFSSLSYYILVSLPSVLLLPSLSTNASSIPISTPPNTLTASTPDSLAEKAPF
jgi:hypothetical protein